MNTSIAKILILSGSLLLLAGIVLSIAGDKLNWLGRLPGDIRVEKENVKIYFPITTMILISVILSMLFWLYKRLMS